MTRSRAPMHLPDGIGRPSAWPGRLHRRPPYATSPRAERERQLDRARIDHDAGRLASDCPRPPLLADAIGPVVARSYCESRVPDPPAGYLRLCREQFVGPPPLGTASRPLTPRAGKWSFPLAINERDAGTASHGPRVCRYSPTPATTGGGRGRKGYPSWLSTRSRAAPAVPAARGRPHPRGSSAG